MTLPKENRLAEKSDFNKVFKEGKAVKGSFLFIKAKKAPEKARFGFIIPKKVSPKASSRNRLKRALSETVRNYINNNSQFSQDVIIWVNKKDHEDTLQSELTRLLELIK